MLFVLDVGNTNTVLGVFEQNTLKYEWRIKTDRHKTEDEFGILIKSLLEHKGIHLTYINGAIISSVVPLIMFALDNMCKNYCHFDPFIVVENIHSHLKKIYPIQRKIVAHRIVI